MTDRSQTFSNAEAMRDIAFRWGAYTTHLGGAAASFVLLAQFLAGPWGFLALAASGAVLAYSWVQSPDPFINEKAQAERGRQAEKGGNWFLVLGRGLLTGLRLSPPVVAIVNTAKAIARAITNPKKAFEKVSESFASLKLWHSEAQPGVPSKVVWFERGRWIAYAATGWLALSISMVNPPIGLLLGAMLIKGLERYAAPNHSPDETPVYYKMRTAAGGVKGAFLGRLAHAGTGVVYGLIANPFLVGLPGLAENVQRVANGVRRDVLVLIDENKEVPLAEAGFAPRVRLQQASVGVDAAVGAAAAEAVAAQKAAVVTSGPSQPRP